MISDYITVYIMQADPVAAWSKMWALNTHTLDHVCESCLGHGYLSLVSLFVLSCVDRVFAMGMIPCPGSPTVCCEQ
jgi:hypothetical protein